MAYKADCAVVLAPLKVAFLGKGDDKRLDPWYGSLSCLPNVIADFMQGSYHGTSSCLYQLSRDIVYSRRFSLLERFHSCFDLFPQDWVVVSVGKYWDSQHLRVTCDCVVVQFRTVFCPPV